MGKIGLERMASELVKKKKKMCFPERQEKNVFQRVGENNCQMLLTAQEED